MNYNPYQNTSENMLSRMKEEENFLPYIYSFFNFADRQNNISCALKPLSGKGEQYIMSREQEVILDSSAADLEAFADYYGDGEYEKYLFVFQLLPREVQCTGKHPALPSRSSDIHGESLISCHLHGRSSL